MKQYVTDTMAIVSYLGKRKMPSSVKQMFQLADSGSVQILIPSIVFFEIGYLSEKGRIDVDLNDVLIHMRDFPTYLEQSLTFKIVVESYNILDIP
jgi:PIN domain nuclease of toxin-antitoxin system